MQGRRCGGGDAGAVPQAGRLRQAPAGQGASGGGAARPGRLPPHEPPATIRSLSKSGGPAVQAGLRRCKTGGRMRRSPQPAARSTAAASRDRASAGPTHVTVPYGARLRRFARGAWWETNCNGPRIPAIDRRRAPADARVIHRPVALSRGAEPAQISPDACRAAPFNGLKGGMPPPRLWLVAGTRPKLKAAIPTRCGPGAIPVAVWVRSWPAVRPDAGASGAARGSAHRAPYGPENRPTRRPNGGSFDGGRRYRQV